MQTRLTLALLFLIVCFTASHAPAAPPEPCAIRVIDADSGWPVPLVELRTTHDKRFVSDNAGMIAFDLPELMNRKTWFFIEGHGYGVPADGFGYRGVRLTPRPGETLTVEVNRNSLARRLGRLTGAGLFGESQQLGLASDWTDQGIVGCDTVQTAVHDGRLYWGWGDTSLARYPLGIFHSLGATTTLRPLDSFEPPLRLRFDYFTNADGNPRAICAMPGDGPTWIDGFASLPDADGRRHLVCHYVKIRSHLIPYENGLAVWDEAQERFEQHKVLWRESEDEGEKPPAPEGHPVFLADPDGTTWAYWGNPFPTLKTPATFEAWSDPARWQPLDPQRTVPAARTGETIRVHNGAIARNDYRDKWVAIFTRAGGSTRLGEIWYAEADHPTGPWRNALKVLEHTNYSFYNPLIHTTFTSPGSPILLFEGTYTKEFSPKDPPHKTPRYNYNQVLYRLDLDDPAFNFDSE